MIKFLFYLNFIFLIVCQEKTDSFDSQDDIVFKLADLTVMFNNKNSLITMEAFKSALNDQIINNKIHDKYSQLTWLSLGNPRLVSFYKKEDDSYKVFHLDNEGFSIFIETLNQDHINLFKQNVKKKYNIDIDPTQIVQLVPSKFECKLTITNENYKHVYIGKAYQLNYSPLEVIFGAPVGSPERSLFDRQTGNLQFKCEAIRIQGKSYKTNILNISSEQIQQLEIIDDIFGPANEVLITRNQMNKLASEIYSKLNIYEEYEIKEDDFDRIFVSDLIKQTAISIDKAVNIDTALEKLSRYNFEQDLRPDIIKKQLEKKFKIDKNGSKSHIIVNNEWDDNSQSASNLQVSAEGSFLGFSAGGSFVKANSDQWRKSGKKLDDQLKELNSHNENDVEWVIEGDKIIPKSLKLSRLSKAKFLKSLYFNRIKKEYTDIQFKKSFFFKTSDLKELERVRVFHNEKIFVNTNAEKILETETDNIRNNEIPTIFPIGMVTMITSKLIDKWFHKDGYGLGQYHGWFICDGRNGTPDLRSRFIVGRDEKNSDYKDVGNTGGFSHVSLKLDEMPSHTHKDSGHSHYIYLNSNEEGFHTHSYEDNVINVQRYLDLKRNELLRSTDTEDDQDRYIPLQNRTYFDNYGKTKITSGTGYHNHLTSGNSQISEASITYSGNNNPHENRPPYYTVVYIIYLYN